MHEQVLGLRSTGKSKVTAFLSLLVAVLMTLAVLPTAHADTSTYTPADDFIAEATPSKAGKLTVNKKLSTRNGVKASGSEQDTSQTTGLEPGVGVTFRLTRVTPTGTLTPGAMKPNDPSTFTRDPSNVYVGKTDTAGIIKNGTGTGDGIWHKEGTTDGVTTFPYDAAAPASWYYLLEEVNTPDNVYLNPHNPLFEPSYTPAESAIFDLPYRATNTVTPTSGSPTTADVSSTTSTFIPRT